MIVDVQSAFETLSQKLTVGFPFSACPLDLLLFNTSEKTHTCILADIIERRKERKGQKYAHPSSDAHLACGQSIDSIRLS